MNCWPAPGRNPRVRGRRSPSPPAPCWHGSLNVAPYGTAGAHGGTAAERVPLSVRSTGNGWPTTAGLAETVPLPFAGLLQPPPSTTLYFGREVARTLRIRSTLAYRQDRLQLAALAESERSNASEVEHASNVSVSIS